MSGSCRWCHREIKNERNVSFCNGVCKQKWQREGDWVVVVLTPNYQFAATNFGMRGIETEGMSCVKYFPTS